LGNNFDKEILNYISKIGDNNFVEKIDSILKLEEINIQTNTISQRFQELNYLEKNVTELNKEIFELQWALKDTSLDYLSYQISENINDIKPKLTDSVDKIYNVFSFIKDWWESKDIYLIEKYKKLFEWIKIFITTNLSTKSIPLEKWFYDYLIIDEASQNDIASIIPLLYRVKNVIIIWDPNQLQNIVSLKKDDIIKIFNKTLRKKNLNSKDYAEDFRDIYNFNNSVYSSFASIYKWNLNKNPVILNEHFRCHEDIINYSNFIIEDYNLFPKIYWKNKYLQNTWIPIWIHWVEDIKNNNPENTKRNEIEAESIIRYLKEILQIMWDKISIWIIAPFRNQVNYINELIRKNKLEWYENVLVDTVHRFQWDEKDIILFSTVYPNTKAYKFLNDVNLLNVAVSRARNSFLIFWDRHAIKNYKWENGEELLYTTLIRYIESVNKWKEVVKYRKYDTDFEKLFFEELEKAWIKFDYQFPIYEWKYTLDFRIKLKWANNYLNLELDGEIHNRQKSYDYTRNRKVEKLWYKVIRYSNSYMKENMWEVVEWLKKICELN
jgi:superfamily I DNA and/or RNA helicase